MAPLLLAPKYQGQILVIYNKEGRINENNQSAQTELMPAPLKLVFWYVHWIRFQ